MRYDEGSAQPNWTWLLVPLTSWLVLFWPHWAFTQNPAPRAFSAKESVQFAWQNNPQIRRSKLETQKVEAQISETISTGLPQLNANAGFNYNAILATSLLPNIFQGRPEELVAVQFGTNINTSYGAELNQLLYSQAFWTGLKATKEVAKFNRLVEAKTAEDVAYNVVKLYYQVQTLAKQRQLVQANLDQVSGLLKATELQFKNGLAKKIDVDQLRVNQVTLNAQRQNLDLQYEQALQGLKFAMAMPLNEPLVLTDTLTTTELPELTTQLSAPSSYQNKIDLTLLDKQADLLQLNVDQYRAGFFPSASAFVNYSRQGQGNKLSDLSWFSASVIGVSVQVPIFDGFKKRSQIQQASIDRLKVLEDRKLTIQSLELQHGNARQQLISTWNTLNALAENNKVAAEVFTVAQKRFKEGLGSITDVLVAERTLRENQANYLSTLLQYRFAVIDLDYANGKLTQMFN